MTQFITPYDRLKWFFRVRLPAKIRLWRGLNDAMNRRATVESYLIDVYAGKRPLPDREKCMELALKLGTPGK